MPKIEELSGILGDFKGELRPHPDPKRRKYGAVADGEITYSRTIGDETKEVTTPVKGVNAKRIRGDFRRFVRITRGPKGKRDKIIGLVDKE